MCEGQSGPFGWPPRTKRLGRWQGGLADGKPAVRFGRNRPVACVGQERSRPGNDSACWLMRMPRRLPCRYGPQPSFWAWSPNFRCWGPASPFHMTGSRVREVKRLLLELACSLTMHQHGICTCGHNMPYCNKLSYIMYNIYIQYICFINNVYTCRPWTLYFLALFRACMSSCRSEPAALGNQWKQRVWFDNVRHVLLDP